LKKCRRLYLEREKSEKEMAEIRENIAKTEAIANSNARSIEAATNENTQIRAAVLQTQAQLVELARIFGQFGQATNTQLEALVGLT